MIFKDTAISIAVMVIFALNSNSGITSYAENYDPVAAESSQEQSSSVTPYQVPLSSELQISTQRYMDIMGVDLDQSYIYALIYHESGFNSKALGRHGDSGYCQILQRYFNSFYSDMVSEYPQLESEEHLTKDIFDEKTNIACGIWYLNDCAKSLSGNSLNRDNLSLALTAYNRGPNNAKKYFKKNRTYSTSYSKKIIYYAEQLQITGILPGK